MTFFHKLYGEWSKVEKPMLTLMSYERFDDEEEEVEVVSTSNENNYYYQNLVSEFNSDNEAKENFFGEQVNNDIKVTQRTPSLLRMSPRC